MALMKDTQGKEHDIVPAGVAALESLGWTVLEPDKGNDGDAKEDKPATKRATRSRAKSD